LNESFADAVPLDCGTNFTVNETLFPAAMMKGKETPLTLNSELLTVAEDTVTDFPLALKDALMLLLLPTVTLPKLSTEGVAVNCPAVPPVPDKAIDIVLLLWP